MLVTRIAVVLIAASLVCSNLASACLWDSDTLDQENKAFPGIMELVTGKFPRHSSAFYEWRVTNREKQLAEQGSAPDPRTVDDLAVAYDKLGRNKEAISLMEAQLARDASRYETHANLGTFYIHGGHLEKGAEYITKAIEINPDAHFGREVYQLLLVQYLLKIRGDGQEGLPLAQEKERFSHFVLAQRKGEYEEESAELAKATKGILGMMRFGKHDSPVLLEALGDLLSHNAYDAKTPKRLAARAYLKAGYEADSAEALAAYRDRAVEVIRLQTKSAGETKQLNLAILQKEFREELQGAVAWYRILERLEAKWIRTGDDPEERFRDYYLSQKSEG